MKDQLEGLVSQMVERGILFEEALGEFEKKFIKRTLERARAINAAPPRCSAFTAIPSAVRSVNISWTATAGTNASCFRFPLPLVHGLPFLY